jgi:hypothetical protein
MQSDPTVPKHEEYADAIAAVAQTELTFDSVAEFQEHHAAMNPLFCAEFTKLTGKIKEEVAPTP